jgi:serine phosphatase RsbU (regulator of sigma subunit)
MKGLCGVTLWLVLAGHVSGTAGVLRLTEHFVSTDTTPYIEYLYSADPFATISRQSAGWAPLQSVVLHERKHGDRIWLRMQVANDSGAPVRLAMVAGEARTDTVLFYQAAAGQLVQHQSGGDLSKRTSMPVYLAPHFAFTVEPRTQSHIFLAVENPVDLAVDFHLLRADVFAEHGGFQYLLQGVFFGALAVLILYYGVIYLSQRTPILAAYFWYLLATAVFFAARTGLLFQGIAFAHASLMNLLVTPLPGILFAAGIRLARVFLKLARGSVHDRILMVAQYVALLPIPVAFCSRAISREICDWLTLILGPGLLVFAWLIRRQVPDAGLFLLGWCWPILASLLQYTGIDTSYLMRNVLLQTSVLMEFVFFSIFVGRDLSRLERERTQQRVHLQMLQEDLEQARRVHETLLPSGAPDVAGLEVRQVYRPMSELGGDYYDWVKLSDTKLVMFVADVTGHGLPAALDAAVVHIAFQSAVVETATAAAILTVMNQRLIAQGIDRCVSAVCAIYDTEHRLLEVSLAGHPQAIVVSGGRPICIGEHAPLLGFSPNTAYSSERMLLAEGDRLFLCTDGAYENPDSQVADDFADFASRLASLSGAPLQATINAAIDYFDKLRRHRSSDDITLLGAQVLGNAV